MLEATLVTNGRCEKNLCLMPVPPGPRALAAEEHTCHPEEHGAAEKPEQTENTLRGQSPRWMGR